MDRDLIEAIHDFWFGPPQQGIPSAEHQRRWFNGGENLDREIRQRFGEAVERALSGDFEDWREQPRSALALVILLDQFPRNCFRGQARAFAGDARALAVSLSLIDAGRDSELQPIERAFLYLPLEHSEQLAQHDRCVTLFEALLADYQGPAAGRELIRVNLDYARRHRLIIQRFGRYPHRNIVLGRVSTEEESGWLAQGGERFGQ